MLRPKFVSADKDEFYRSLRKKVNRYFKENNLKKTGNFGLFAKTIILFSTLILPLAGIILLPKIPAYFFLPCWVLMGISMSGIGLSVMHEAVHGSFSSNRRLNDFIGHVSMFFIGGFAANWRIQHNQLHHTYTNIKDLDEDINPAFSVIRLSTEFPHKSAHRFQHIYAWFLYGMMTLMWATTKDFSQLMRFKRDGFYDNDASAYATEWIRLLFFKVMYFVIFLFVPIAFAPYSAISLVGGFVLMHFVSGFILGIVFQPAHVTTSSEFPNLDENNNILNSWAGHQLQTTQNFAMENKWLSWYVGGLNFQIEHHLFPNISHVHFKNLSKIVQEEVKEFNLPYHSKPTFRSAIYDHAKMLVKLGKS